MLLSAHVCHPSLANDNCSGLALLTHLAQDLAGANAPPQLPLRVCARHDRRDYLARPATSAQRGPHQARSRSLLRRRRRRPHLQEEPPRRCADRPGDGASSSATRRSQRPWSRISAPTATTSASTARRASICRSGRSSAANTATFPEYHTSADDLDLIAPEHLAQSYRLILAIDILDILEGDRMLVNTNPKCEPALGKRGLYDGVGGDKTAAERNMAMLWVLNFGDGQHSWSISPSARVSRSRLLRAQRASTRPVFSCGTRAQLEAVQAAEPAPRLSRSEIDRHGQWPADAEVGSS